MAIYRDRSELTGDALKSPSLLHYLDKRIRTFREVAGQRTVQRILDLGCGTGIFSNLLAEGSEVVVGMDVDLSMLSAAKKSKSERVFLCRGSATRLPFKDSYFDLIFCNVVLHHLDDLNGSIDEIKRILKKDGILTAIEPNRYNILLFILGLFKKDERKTLEFSKNKIINLFSKKNFKDVTAVPCNHLIFPTLTFCDRAIVFKFLLRIEKALDRSTLFLENFSSHYVVGGRK